jgi:hypothetical protein
MSSFDPADALAARTTRRRILATGTKLAYAAPLVAASLKISAGPAFAQVVSPGGGCADLFAQPDETGAITPICCPPQLICAGATAAASDDQCCYEDEVCLTAGCCRTCGTDGSGNTICCDQTEQCVTDPATGAKTCESLNTARLNRFRL